MRGRWARAVQVRFRAVKNRTVSNRHCVGVIRGGEPRNENDQSVTPDGPAAAHRELDSVRVDGRACARRAKPVSRR